MQGQQQNGSNKYDPGGAFNLIAFLACVHAATLTPFIRRGFGLQANGWNAFGAMIVLLVFCGESPSDIVMECYAVSWFLALLFQKAYTLRCIRRGEKIHSRYWGDPWIALKLPFVRTEGFARRFEPSMCFVIGACLLWVSPALAALWMFGLISLTVILCVDHVVTQARMQAIDDAEIEARYYADLRNRREW